MLTIFLHRIQRIPSHRSFSIDLLSYQLYCGVLIATQPFLVAGIEDVDTAKSSAFGAAGMFLFTFLASMAAMWYDSNNKKEPVNGDASSEVEYHLSHDTPATYGTAS